MNVNVNVNVNTAANQTLSGSVATNNLSGEPRGQRRQEKPLEACWKPYSGLMTCFRFRLFHLKDKVLSVTYFIVGRLLVEHKSKP